jgi:lipopolysaccharide export system protein LptC
MLRLFAVFSVCIFLQFGGLIGSNLYRFSLPLFDEQGKKICSIYGRKADLSDDKIFKISDIMIQTFSENEKNIPKLFIMSDQAVLNIQDNSAFGDGFIAVTGGEFSATGQKWKFTENGKKFTLDKNVQVFFEKNQFNSP